MDIQLFNKMFTDKAFFDCKKMKYKYGSNYYEFLDVLKQLYYKALPFSDFEGHNAVFLENYVPVKQRAVKLLLESSDAPYSVKSAGEEVIATSAIESIDFSRESVRNVFKGLAPANQQEFRIMGLKNGLEFIGNVENNISEENIYRLYMMAVGDFLDEESRLPKGSLYRQDEVFVVSDKVEHSGAPYAELPKLMKQLVEFINTDDDINDLEKASIIHFCFAFIHPYFDGNGRMARLLHLWFLFQKGYRRALFFPFSSSIEKNRRGYYKAFTQIEENKAVSGVLDITPFISFFAESVYNKIPEEAFSKSTSQKIGGALTQGKLTPKEKELWKFVVSHYGKGEFSTKQLEKDFGNAAYATIRSFALKLCELELLTPIKYGSRTKYKVAE